MLSVLVLLLVVAAASFAYRAFWMLRARPSSRYVGSRFRDEVVAMSRRQRRRAFWGNVLLCVLCVAAMVLVGVLVGGVTVRRRFASGPSACPAGFRLVCGPDRRRLV